MLAVTFLIDYSLDSYHFFDAPDRRALLQRAADTIGQRLSDSLSPIIPGGTDTWNALTDNPATGQPLTIANPIIPANTIVVFAGARPLLGSEVGKGGFGGFNSSGTPAWNQLVASRGQAGALAITPTDFATWGGTIAFDTTANWYFGADAAGLKPSQNDFLSVAFHELEHLIGFGTSPSWKALNSGGQFLGPASMAAYDGPGLLALSPDGGHWAQGTTDGGFETVMDPSILLGTRKLPTRLDYAGLQDVGWTFNSDPDGTIAQAAIPVITGLDTKALPGLTLGPDPGDVDMFQVVGSAGQVLVATTSRHLGGPIVDTYLRVFDATGKQLATSDMVGYDTLTYQLPADGSYYIGVSGTDNVAYSPVEDLARRLGAPTGQYDLQVSLVPPSSVPRADLKTQVSTPTTGIVGQPFTYSTTVTNIGPDPAPAAKLTQSLPLSVTFVSAVSDPAVPVTFLNGIVTADFGSLAAGGGGTLTITVIPNAVTTVISQLSASSTQVDPISSNNTGAATTIISPAPLPDTVPPVVSGKVQILKTGKKGKKSSVFVVNFNEAIVPQQAQDLGNYLLTRPGKARRGKIARRIPIGIRGATYDDATHSVTLVPAARGALPRGLRLTVYAGSPHSGIHDLAGNALDGNRDGTAGDDATLVVT